MKKEHKYAGFGFIALTALRSVGMEKPNKQDFQSTVIPQEKHELVLEKVSDPLPESKILPNPVPATPLPELSPPPPKIIKNNQGEEVIFESQEYINEQKDQKEKEDVPKYTSVDWDSLSLIDKEHVDDWEDLILKHANEFDVQPKIIAVTIDTESHGRTDGKWKELEGDGAGLMGVMPNDENNSFPNRPDRETLINNHDVNISLGTAILDEIHENKDQGDGSWFKTFLWYNAGLRDKLKYAIPYAKHLYSKLGWKKSKDDTATLIVIKRGAYDPPDRSD